MSTPVVHGLYNSTSSSMYVDHSSSQSLVEVRPNTKIGGV